MLFSQSSAQFTHSGRGMYVDKFFRTAKNTAGTIIVNPVFSVLGIPAKEDSLLKFAKENHITYLVLYDLYYVFGNATFEAYLCSFIQKAKTQYCIEQIGAASSCSGLFDDIFNSVPSASISFSEGGFSKSYSSEARKQLSIVETQYQPGDSLFILSEITKLNMRLAAFNDVCAYKIDLMVSEYEFWNASVDDCEGDLPSKDVKYVRYQTLINNMDVIRDNYNSTHTNHKLFVETYLGYLNQNTAYTHQVIANWIDGTYNGKRRTDRINSHYYGTDPSKLYSRTTAGQNNSGYYLTRFKDFCQNTTVNQTNFLPIFSSEYIPWGAGTNFLGGWFSQNVNNNIFTAEKYFYDDWYDDAQNFSQSTVGSPTLGTVVKPGGVIWFTSTQLVNHVNNPVLFTSNSPVCVTSGQNGILQFQYQGPIEQGLSFKFYITNAGNSTIRCGSINSITWPVYNPITKTSLDLNAALGSCSLPVGDYDAHLEFSYANGCTAYIAPIVKVSIVNSGKIVALTPTTVCQGNPVYLQANSSGAGTTSYAWYDGTTAISGATSSTYAPSATSTGTRNYSCLISSSISGCSANKSNVIPVTINTFPASSITKQSNSSCSVTLQANPTGGTYVWHDGSTGPSYSTSILGTYSVAVTKNGCTYNSPNFTISSISGTGTVVPSALISANTGNSICTGTTVIFTATPSNGGTTPFYQWKKNGINVGTNSNTYTNSSLTNNEIISCVLTSNLSCASPLTATSNSITMSVSTIVVPGISIVSNVGNTICFGSNVVFTATPANGGSTPVYQWRKNAINVGTSNNVYSENTLMNSDVINCIMTGSANCPSAATVSSSNIVMTVNPIITSSVSIISNLGNSICSGTNVTFTATPVNGGPNPFYQWKKNGINVGTNSSSYSDNALVNNNNITCEMTSNLLCVSPAIATSNGISMTVTSISIPSVSVNTNTGNSICAGSNVIFTAIPVNGGVTPLFQWKKNGINVGSNSNTYSDNALVNNNIITCILTSNANCVSPVTATSNTVVMFVNTIVTPQVSINADVGNTICEGTTVTFTATPVNGGINPFYQWKRNGGVVGSNSNIYSDYTLSNNDDIVCEMTSNASCTSGNPAISNSINMIVNSCVQLNLKVFIQGYYRGGNAMAAVVDPDLYPTLCDSLIIELHNANAPFNIQYYTKGVIDINGNGQFIFPPGILNNNYFIVVRHRNALETWSNNPVLFNASTVQYDFSTSASNAFGANQVDLGDGNFALWSGDVNNGITPGIQDGLINNLDHVNIEDAIGLFITGYEIIDLTGDGIVESSDYSLIEYNSILSISVLRP